MQDQLIYVQKPADKNKLLELLDNIPESILGSDYKAILWIDEIKRIAKELK
jgi:hypothetical protein